MVKMLLKHEQNQNLYDFFFNVSGLIKPELLDGVQYFHLDMIFQHLKNN